MGWANRAQFSKHEENARCQYLVNRCVAILSIFLGLRDKYISWELHLNFCNRSLAIPTVFSAIQFD